jgi:putative colanic acid biosynthesis UDP-glucose lipid carrier transferase
VAYVSGGLLRPHSSRLAVLNRILDVYLIWESMRYVCLYFGVKFLSLYAGQAVLGVASFLFLAEMRGVYASWRMVSAADLYFRVLTTWLIAVAFVSGIDFLARGSFRFSLFILATWFFAVPSLLILQRFVIYTVLREMRGRGWNSRNLAIIGSGKSAQKLVDWVGNAEWMGLKLVGIFEDRKERSEGDVAGSVDELLEAAKEGRVDYVYVALPMRAESRIVEIVNAFSDTTASVYIMPDSFVFDLMHARWINMGGIPMVSVFESPFYGVNGWMKRIEDLVLGSLILTIIAIPMLFISIGVKLTSSGPVLFRQRRYGLNGNVVEVWKFRSMTCCEDGPEIAQAKKEDSRVTPFGAFLRRTSLDELPQFINVLQGHMSIVGPRPHAVAHNEQYRRLIHGYMLRHKVKPGITGWAQVNGWRGETETVEKMKARVECDLYYIQNWSLMLDIRIIFLTLFRGFVGKSAY